MWAFSVNGTERVLFRHLSASSRDQLSVGRFSILLCVCYTSIVVISSIPTSLLQDGWQVIGEEREREMREIVSEDAQVYMMMIFIDHVGVCFYSALE